MLLPIAIRYYQRAKSTVTMPGENKWADKWDVCITCDSAESAKALSEALRKIDVDVLMNQSECCNHNCNQGRDCPARDKR